MPGIENLDKDKNQQIDLLEIQEALKPNGFLDSKNKNFEDNITHFKQELQKNSYEPQKEYLKTSLHDTLTNAKYNIQEKIKKNTPLTGEEIKILKLAFFLESPSYYKVDFNDTDWKKDTSISLWISTINPIYQNSKSLDGIKKTVDNLTSTESISENREVLQSTLGAAKEMLGNFCQTLQQTMTGASDYTFYHNFMYDVQEFLKGHQTNQCTNYTEYQVQMKQIAKFFNEYIKSNGKLDATNPAYIYMQNQSAFQSVSTDAFVNVGNIFTTLSNAKTQRDIENAKGKAYTNTREMLGGNLYLMGKRGYLGSFHASENMGKLEEDVINSEVMKKYPDLKIISEFLKDLKKESGSKQTLGLDTQYQKLINKLNGKVPTKFILFLQKKFEDQKEDMQKEINTVYSAESIDAVQSLAIMNVLGEHQQHIQVQLSKEELILAAKSYKETGKFTESVMTRLEAFGISSIQIKKEIENKARDLRIQQYNQMIFSRLRSFTLENSLDANPARAESLGKNNQLFKVYNDIKGVGHEGGSSDAGIQKWKSMSEQILISIAVTAFSGGIGSLAAGAALGGIEAATVGGRILLFAAKMIVEGMVFHGVNTITTGVISGDLNSMLHELKSPKAWAQSILYMGVMNGVGMAFRLGTMPGLKTIERAASLTKSVKVGQLMNALNTGMQFSTEILGMMTTDQIVSLTFDQKIKDINIESVMQTVTLVIGLKAAHKIVPMTPPQGAITSDEVQITALTKSEGVVTDVGYTQKVMTTIDAKVDYLAKLCKIKSGVRANVATNILNSITIDVAKNPGKDYSKSLEEVKNTIEQLRQEGKLSTDLEKKYNEIQEKTIAVTMEEKNEIIKNTETNKNQLNIPSEIQNQNSLNSDKLINADGTINIQAKLSTEKFLREQKVLGKDEILNEEQIKKIYEVHTMSQKAGENETQLNIRKGIALKSLFTSDQIRALMEGKVCGVIESATMFDVIKVIEEKGIGEDPQLPNAFLDAIGVKKGNIDSEQLGMIGVLWSRLNNNKNSELKEIFKSIPKETRDLLNAYNIDLAYLITDTGKTSNIKRLWNTDGEMLKKCINESGVSVLDMDGIGKVEKILFKEELLKYKNSSIEEKERVFGKFYYINLPIDNKFKSKMEDNDFYAIREQVNDVKLFDEIVGWGITPIEYSVLADHKGIGITRNMYDNTYNKNIIDEYKNVIMNSALRKIQSQEGFFFRGINISPSIFESQIVEENGKRVWRDKGYTGSTLDQTYGEKNANGKVSLIIEGKNAKPVEMFWGFDAKSREAEHLFPSGTPFEVVEIKRNVLGKYGENIEMVVKLKEIENIQKNIVDQKTTKDIQKPNPEIVKANAKLNDTDRILAAKKLLGLEKITAIQEQAILDAHNQPGEIFNLNFSQIKTRLEILEKGGFSPAEIRTLMENGICGKVEAAMLEKNKDMPNNMYGDEIKKSQKLLEKNIITIEQYDNIINNINTAKSSFRELMDTNESNPIKKQEIIEQFKEYRKNAKEVVASLPDKIMEYFDNNPTATAKEAVTKYYESIKNLDGNIQIHIMEKIVLYKSRIDTIEKYINLPKYKNNPAELLCEIRGADFLPNKLLEPNTITMKREGANIIFFVKNEIDYMKIYTNSEDILIQNEQYIDNHGNIRKKSGGFACVTSEIPGLEGTLNVINAKNIKTEREQDVIKHENRHTLNKYLFTELDRNPLVRAKDEIIAFLKDGSSPTYIYETLGKKGGLYDYYEYKKTKITPDIQETYDRNRKTYDVQLKKSIDITKKMQVAGIDNYLDILAITPINQRGKLEKIYTKEITKSSIMTMQKKIIAIEEVIKNHNKNIEEWRSDGTENALKWINKANGWVETSEQEKVKLETELETQKNTWKELTGKERGEREGLIAENNAQSLVDIVETIIEGEFNKIIPSENILQKENVLVLLKKYVDKVNIPLNTFTALVIKFSNNFKGFLADIKALFVSYPDIVLQITTIDKENVESVVRIPDESQKNKKNIQGEKKITIDPEIVKANAKLNDTDRILTAKKLPGLEKITAVQEQAILDAHNQPGEIYNLNFSQIKTRLEILKNAGFDGEQIRTLMENGICGKNTRDIVLKTINPIKKMLMSGNVDWVLTKIERFAPSEALVVTEMPSNFIDGIYSFADKFCNSRFGFEISDVTLFLGKLKMLRDAAAGATILYTEKLQQKNDMQEVMANAKLSWEPRVNKGWGIVENIGDIQLNETQKEIMKKTIMKAHTYGHSETGKNGEPASIYNYTMHQLGVKMYTLMEGMEKCGIENSKSKEIAKELLRKGICGEIGDIKEFPLHHDKIKNIDINHITINGVKYNKKNKPVQGFDTQNNTPTDFVNNPQLLKKFYTNEVLPNMKKTDGIKIKVMQDITQALGGEIKNAPLKGETDPARAVQKVIDDYGGDINKLSDISRGTLLYENVDQVYSAYNKVLQHPEVVSAFVKDNFQRRTGYRDINLVVTTKTGKSFELQINTKKLLESKEKGLEIPREYIDKKMEDIRTNPNNNLYGDVLQKLYNQESPFDKIDHDITNTINKNFEAIAKKDNKQHEYISLPQNGENINGHKLYELNRILENVLDREKNPDKEIPVQLNEFTYDELDGYSKKLTNYSNLLYDYAHSLSK